MDFRTNDFRAQIARYEQELLRLQQAAIPVQAMPQPPAPQPAEPQTPPLQPTESQTPPPQPTIPQPFPVSPPKTAFTAPLQVRVSAASDAMPIPGAVVVISSQSSDGLLPEQTLITDNSGLTEPVLLPAIDPALTLQPNSSIAPVIYEVTVSVPGYYRVRTVGIPLYGGIPTQLPVVLIPLPEFADGSGEELRFSTPPMNL